MMRLMLLVFTISCVTARRIKFIDCGNKDVKWIDVEPCKQEPCEFSSGDNVKVTAKAIANHPSQKVKLYVKMYAGVGDLPLPDIDQDGCKVVPCPLVDKKKFKFTVNFVFPMIMPAIPGLPDKTKTNLTLELHGDQKQLVCAKANIVIKQKKMFDLPFGKN